MESSEVWNGVNELAHAVPPLTAIPLLPIMAAAVLTVSVRVGAQPLQQVHDPLAAKQKGATPFNFNVELSAVMQEQKLPYTMWWRG